MKALAQFVMRGRAQATMMAATLAMLSLLLPPASLLSSAVVALVTLRRGANDGLAVVGLALAVTAVLAWFALGGPLPALAFALALWLPVWLVGLVLRNARSLPRALEAALLLGLLMVVVLYLVLGDPAARWRSLLETVFRQVLEDQVIDDAQLAAVVDNLAGWMTGVLAAGFFLQVTLALLLARWWQAQLYNPGGLRAEFHGLRLSRWVAFLTLPVIVAASLGWGTDFVRQIGLVLAAGWFIQGLALAHGMLAQLQASTGWLVGIYVLLVVAMPHAFTALATAGFADAWLDFRRRGGKDKRDSTGGD